MIASNGIIRIARKGLRKFAFGEDGEPFEVDVVSTFQQWLLIDASFRPDVPDDDGNAPVPNESIPDYHQAAVKFVQMLATAPPTQHCPQPVQPPNLTIAEALDFIARLREQYDELADFFRPKLRERPGSPATSAAGSPDTSESTSMRFSEEKVD